jgi:hypothetical protein
MANSHARSNLVKIAKTQRISADIFSVRSVTTNASSARDHACQGEMASVILYTFAMKLAGPYTQNTHNDTTIFLADTPFCASKASCTLSSPAPTTYGSGAATNFPSAIASGKYRSNNARLISL